MEVVGVVGDVRSVTLARTPEVGARGAVLANIGAVMTGLGGVAFCAGIRESAEPVAPVAV